MDSPDQKAFGIPVPTTTFEANTITVELPNAKMIYKGTPNADFSEIVGTFSQMGSSIPLNLNRKPFEKVVLNRPQTPRNLFHTNRKKSFLK